MQISIHALREEGDHCFSRSFSRTVRISIHALREEGDISHNQRGGIPNEFLSTPSARRATRPDLRQHRDRSISIHALREEGDPKAAATASRTIAFLSTPSARRATSELDLTTDDGLFLSTPSARRATRLSDAQLARLYKFLSTPSARRATAPHVRRVGGMSRFLSTPSARRATNLVDHPSHVILISIHALREEGDLHVQMSCSPRYHFYPRPPRGGRHACKPFLPTAENFYPRPPRGGRLAARCIRCRLNGFLSTPSARRAT